MESIDKLRKCITGDSPVACALVRRFTDDDGMSASDSQTRQALGYAIDAIESEIAERYMELPLDKDGVPIRIGDKIEHRTKFAVREVTGIGRDCAFFGTHGDFGRCVEVATGWHHVKPDTWESIIQEVYELGLEDGEECSTERSDFSDFIERCEKLAGVD